MLESARIRVTLPAADITSGQVQQAKQLSKEQQW